MGARIGKNTLNRLGMARLDAGENIFLLRQVEFISTRSYDVKFPLLFARKFIPVNNQIDRSAATYTYPQYTQVGMAKLLASYADDLQRADVYVKEFSSAIKPLGDSYGYNINEIRQAMRAQVPLDQKKANAARRAVETLIDRILALGDTAAGLVGMINQPNALSFTIPNGLAGTPQWSTKKPLEILSDMVNICAFIPTSTGNVEEPNAILLPRSQYTQVATTPYSTSASDLTVLEYFKRNNPGVDVGMWPLLATQGVASTDRMIAYNRDPEKLEGIIPQEFEQFPPEQEGLNFQVACHARIGGVVFYYPLSMAVADGI
jgi:hypothetical protein